MFNTVLHDTYEAILYTTAFVYFDSEALYLKMEEIRQEIQDATSYYLVNIPTTNTNILDKAK